MNPASGPVFPTPGPVVEGTTEEVRALEMPPALGVALGSAGKDDVRVVARRVGENRWEADYMGGYETIWAGQRRKGARRVGK